MLPPVHGPSALVSGASLHHGRAGPMCPVKASPSLQTEVASEEGEKCLRSREGDVRNGSERASLLPTSSRDGMGVGFLQLRAAAKGSSTSSEGWWCRKADRSWTKTQNQRFSACLQTSRLLSQTWLLLFLFS